MKRFLAHTGLAGVAVAAVVMAAAALPAAADHGHGLSEPSPSPTAAPACHDVTSGSLSYTRDRDALGNVLDRGVAVFSVTVGEGADSCVDVTYAASFYYLNGVGDLVELAHDDRAGDGIGGIAFRLPVVQYAGNCVYAAVRVIADGQVADTAPDDPTSPPDTTEACDGGPSAAGTGWS